MFTLTGQLHHVGDVSHFGQDETAKRTIVVTTDPNGRYPKHTAIELYKDQAESFNGTVGQGITVECWQPESREHNGRWYTNLKAKSVRVESQEPTVKEQDVPF